MTALLLLLLGLASQVQGQALNVSECDVHYTFELREWIVDYLRPTVDLGGKAKRKSPEEMTDKTRKAALLVNNQYPGPLVEATEGQFLCITVINQLAAESTAIHWHGIKMRGYPSMDGVYGVTQSGIPPQGGTFTYGFVPTKHSVGTHWWHAHLMALQPDRGLKGPIVIHAKNDPHKHLYDEERVITLSDEWQHVKPSLKNEGVAKAGNPVRKEIDKASWNGVWGDGSPEYPWPTTVVEEGKCYRMRFIGIMGGAQNFKVQMAGHNMTMIATDGIDLEPKMVSEFNLHAGERVDVVVCANQAPGNYLMSAVYDQACQLENFPVEVPQNVDMPRVDTCKFWSFLKYQGHEGHPGKATKKPWGGYFAPHGSGGGRHPKKVQGLAWDTALQSAWQGAVRPLIPIPEPEEPDVRYVIDIGIKGPRYQTGVTPFGTTDQYYMFTEPLPWKKPQSPLLHTKGKCGADDVPFIDVPENATTVELVINNLTPTAHILHLHGMDFSVINYAPYSEKWCKLNYFWCQAEPDPFAKAALCDNARRGDPNTSYPLDAYWGCPYDAAKHKSSQNLEAPLIKDLVPIWRRSWVVLRFKADNPGAWMFHCHSEHHLILGQMMAFNIKPSEQPPIPWGTPTEGPCDVWSKARPPKRVEDVFV